jgi:hypothetical protein
MTPEEMKNASRGYSTDMSPEAMAKRLRIMSELSAFTRWLGTAVPVERDEPKPSADPARGGNERDDAPRPPLGIP